MRDKGEGVIFLFGLLVLLVILLGLLVLLDRWLFVGYSLVFAVGFSFLWWFTGRWRSER